MMEGIDGRAVVKTRLRGFAVRPYDVARRHVITYTSLFDHVKFKFCTFV